MAKRMNSSIHFKRRVKKKTKGRESYGIRMRSRRITPKKKRPRPNDARTSLKPVQAGCRRVRQQLQVRRRRSRFS